MTATATATPTAKFPCDLQRYIRLAQSDAVADNCARHIPTCQSEYEQIATMATYLYSVGQEFINSVDKDDLPRCNRLYALDQECGSNDLIEAVVLGKRMIVPRYVTLIEQMRRLRAAIV